MRSLGVTPGAGVPSKRTQHGARPALVERLGRQHMVELGPADAESERAQAAMGAGVAVAAHQKAARQGDAELGPHDVDDALAGLVDVEQADAGGGGFLAQRRHQLDAARDGAGAAGGARHRVVDGGEGELGIVHRAGRAP